MKKIGNFLRYSFAVLLVILTFLILLAGIPTLSVTSRVTNRSTLHQWVKESRVTDGIVDKAIKTGLTRSNDAPELKKLLEEIDNPNTELGQLKNSVLTQEKIDNAITTLINAGYDWFEGKTNKPTFEIQLVKDNAEMNKLVTAGFKIKFESLPECEGVVASLDNFDPLEANCRPKGLKSSIVETFIAAHQNDPEFKKLSDQTKLTSDTITIDQKVTDQVQRAYRFASRAILIWAGTVLILLCLISLLLFDAKRALFVNGIALVIVSFLWLIAGWVLSVQRTNITRLAIEQTKKSKVSDFMPVVESLITVIYKDIISRLLLVSGTILVIGIIMVLLGIAIKKYYSKKQL